MRLLAPFFFINSKISMDLITKFNIEQGTKKLFKAIVADGGEVDTRLGLMRTMLYDVPKIMYNTYTFSPRQGKHTRPGQVQVEGKKKGSSTSLSRKAYGN